MTEGSQQHKFRDRFQLLQCLYEAKINKKQTDNYLISQLTTYSENSLILTWDAVKCLVIEQNLLSTDDTSFIRVNSRRGRTDKATKGQISKDQVYAGEILEWVGKISIFDAEAMYQKYGNDLKFTEKKNKRVEFEQPTIDPDFEKMDDENEIDEETPVSFNISQPMLLPGAQTSESVTEMDPLTRLSRQLMTQFNKLQKSVNETQENVKKMVDGQQTIDQRLKNLEEKGKVVETIQTDHKKMKERIDGFEATIKALNVEEIKNKSKQINDDFDKMLHMKNEYEREKKEIIDSAKAELASLAPTWIESHLKRNVSEFQNLLSQGRQRSSSIRSQATATQNQNPTRSSSFGPPPERLAVWGQGQQDGNAPAIPRHYTVALSKIPKTAVYSNDWIKENQQNLFDTSRAKPKILEVTDIPSNFPEAKTRTVKIIIEIESKFGPNEIFDPKIWISGLLAKRYKFIRTQNQQRADGPGYVRPEVREA